MKVLQDEFELAAFMGFLEHEGARSYLEIGSYAGGTLRWIGTALEQPSTIVAVDLGVDVEHKNSLTHAINYLNAMGHRSEVLWGDSAAPDIIKAVGERGPFDVVFIDGNHSMPYIVSDWQHYGPLGRIVCFHDISWQRGPNWRGTAIEVPKFWSAIKTQYRHAEIRLDPSRKNNGIGILWRC